MRPVLPAVLLSTALVALAAPAAAETHEVHFRQGVGAYRGAVDLTISSQNARWTQGDGLTDRKGPLACYKTAGNDAYEARALLRFSGLALPPGSRVVAASLTLAFDTWASGFTLRAGYLRRGFDPDARRLGWQQRDGAARWAGPGASARGQDIRETPVAELGGFRGVGAEVRTLALHPEVVNDWLRDPAQNHGLVLWNDTPGAVVRIAAAEDPDPRRRPVLTLRYEGPAMPDPSPLPSGEVASAAASTPAARTDKADAKPAPTSSASDDALPSGPPPAVTGPLAPPRLAVSAGRPRILLSAAALERLWRRAAAKDPAWLRLRARCDGYLRGTIEWSDGKDYPGEGNIGEGYQGSDYFDGLMNLALCYQVARHADETRARAFGRRGAELLFKMSETSGPHAPDPLRNSGYAIRFFGAGMAFGYDWLYDALESAQQSGAPSKDSAQQSGAPSKDAPARARIRAALQRWFDAYEKKGFGHEHPQGNYFAGYYAAKGLAGLALRGEDPAGTWEDFLQRVHRGFVAPYYAEHLRGGGWPEGWNYGPLGAQNMSLPLWAARTALALDLSTTPPPYRYPLEQGAYLLHFTWPSRVTLDDRQTMYPGNNPSSASPALFGFTASLLRLFGDPLAPQVQRAARLARERSARDERPAPWHELLFWDGAAPEGDLASLPRSYVARGIGQAALRSGWDEGAVWASFSAGPYVNYDGSGEQYYDQGGLAIVRGARPFLVNAVAALNRHSPGTKDGEGLFDPIYNDLYNRGSRTLFNIFYVDRPRPFGQAARGPSEARTRLAVVEDAGPYVALRGANLEDMYRGQGRLHREVEAWTRDVVYLRPQVFVLHDRTRVRAADADQWQALHFPRAPVAVPGAPQTRRFEVGQGERYVGTVTTVLPRGNQVRLVDLFNRGKVTRLEVRPGAPGERQRWLTVLDAAARPAAAAVAAPLSARDGTVLEGPLEGVVLRGAAGPETQGAQVALFVADDDPERRLDGTLRYRAPAGQHVVSGLPAGASCGASAVSAGADADPEITIRLGASGAASCRASAAGLLALRVGKGGVVECGR